MKPISAKSNRGSISMTADKDPIEATQRVIDNHAEPKVLYLGGDYGPLEARVLASLIKGAEGPVIIKASRSGQIAGLFDVLRDAEPIQPEMKPDGRSLAYLKHDRTKRHGRRR